MSDATPERFQVQGLDHVAIEVSDLQKSVQWYHDVLRLERRHQEAWGDYPIMMCAGDTGVALFPARPRDSGEVNARIAPTIQHFAFRTNAANYSDAKAALQNQGI